MYTIKRGDTAPILEIYIRDSSESDLVGLTDRVYTDFAAKYLRNGAASATTITLASGSAGDAYSSGKLAEVSDGYYQIHLPTAMVADGVDRVNLILTVTGGLTINIPILLVAADTYNLIDGTSSPATAAAVSALNDFDPAAESVTVGTNNDKTGYALTSGERTSIGGAVRTALLGLFRLITRKDAAVATDEATDLTAINADGGSGGGSYDNTTDSHEAIRDRGDAEWVTGAGGGDGARTVTVTVDDGSTVLENATVRFTSGVESYVQSTDASGNATFNLDDATWTVAITKAGHSFAGDTLVVDGDKTPTYSMTAISISAPASPDQTTGFCTTFDGQGNVAGGTTIDFSLVLKDDSGKSYTEDKFTATSNASTGLLEVALIRGATYRARRGDLGVETEFTAGSSATYELPQILGGASGSQLR